jgi:CelD/BcsL family acetyltransferase involved in cellulose biosynthesis
VTDAKLIVDLSTLEKLAPEWDALAVASDMPMSSPAWMLGWWRHAAPPEAELRVAVVRDSTRLTGIVPLYVIPTQRSAGAEYRLLASDFSSTVAPLAQPGREWEVARECAQLLAVADPVPHVLALEPIPLASHWLPAFRDGWPSPLRPLASTYDIWPSWIVSMRGTTFEQWLAGRSGHLRRELRRRSSRFQAAGGSMRLTTAETINADIEAFVRLHAGRWGARGWSRLLALGSRLPRLLHDLAKELLAQQRFRLSLLEIHGEPIGADVSLSAGAELVSVNLGWDERYSRLSPAQLILQRKLEDAFARGNARVNLGFGENATKLAFATGTEPVAWNLLLPFGRSLPGVIARTSPALLRSRVRHSAERTLTAAQLQRVRKMRSRLAP